MLEIFISHSSRDADVAVVLADMFQSALLISAKAIRCTSADGYRLPVGANTDQELRREVLEAKVLVGLISSKSFESAYVLFELGARWGSNAFMAPVVVPGTPVSIIKGPLSGFNALSCSNPAQIHQLIDNVAAQLGRPSESPSTYQKFVDRLTAVSPAEVSEVTTTTHQDENADASEVGKDSESILKEYCLSQWGDDFTMRVHCENTEREAVRKILSSSYEDVPQDVLDKIRKGAARQWPREFGMRLHTEKQQIAAFRKLTAK